MRTTASRLAFALLVLGLALGTMVPTLAQDDDITIGFVTHVVGNPFIQQIIEGARAAAEDLGVTLVEGGPEGFDPDGQLGIIQDMVAAGADGVATSVAGESMANGLNELIESGVPVVQFNLRSDSVNAPYVGERSTESGRILGNAILARLGGPEATGTVLLGICLPGHPILENRSRGVQESLSQAPGVEVLGPFDVKVDAVENYAQWESQLAANPDVNAMVGLCAPDVESLGKLRADMGASFIAGGYDLTEGNLTAIQEGNADITVGQSPFVQGYLPVLLLVNAIRNGETLEPLFYDAGSQVVSADSVDMGNGLPAVSFDELVGMSADAAATADFYAPWIACMSGPGWACSGEPMENEGA